MSTLKPFYVTLSYSGVVMAESQMDAFNVADLESREIVSDQCEAAVDSAVELKSIAHLRRIDRDWDGECCAYGDETPRLKDVLPEDDPPERDTRTADMFGEATGGAA